jgi:acyl carrier protein
MPYNARQLGLEATMNAVCRLLVDRFQITSCPEHIPADAPLFAVGVGLSSIDGMEFLLELEREFGVRIKDVEWWVNESPTLTNVAEMLIELSEPAPAMQPPGGDRRS